MERELWTALCAFAARLHNRWTPARYGDEAICAVYWWAVVHDRPTSWACRRENWPTELVRRTPAVAADDEPSPAHGRRRAVAP